MPTLAALPACATWPAPAVGVYLEGELLEDPRPDEYMRYWQANRCGFCGAKSIPLHRDHDHVTGFMRGYLCVRCNTMETDQFGREWRYWVQGYNTAEILGVQELFRSSNWGQPVIKELAWERARSAGVDVPLPWPWPWSLTDQPWDDVAGHAERFGYTY